MTKEDALAGLSSTSAHDRLKSARFLARNSDPSDLEVLRGALKTETVSYVRTSLELAIKQVSNAASLTVEGASEEIEIPLDIRAQIRSHVTEEVTGQLLHEVSSPLGLLVSSAAREIPDYAQSRTKYHVDAIRRVFEAIEQLKGATAVPRPTEFDLAELVAEIALEVVGDCPIEVSLHGAKPMLITSDRTLLGVAVSNGVRNAVEAVIGTLGNEPHPIIVTWGETDIDYWVSVLDRGPGVVGSTESAFGIGKSTKKGHSGFGLTIARQAIETLGGVCSLQPAVEGGARFEVRWEL